jgi:hypothetical protein
LISAGCWLAGCPEGPPDEPAPAAPGTILPPSADPNDYLLLVRLNIVSIEVPIGAASESERIWSYLDEEAMQTYGSANLAINGLRVGRGLEGTWPDMERILTELTGQKLRQGRGVSRPGSPTPITLRKDAAQRTIFTFYLDRLLTGADYPAGDYVLSVSCTLNRDEPSKLVLTAVPQIRTHKRETAFVETQGRIRMVQQPKTYDFNALLFQVPMETLDYVIVGPSQSARRANSAGGGFFTHDKEGMLFETILVLRPEVIAVEARKAERWQPQLPTEDNE